MMAKCVSVFVGLPKLEGRRMVRLVRSLIVALVMLPMAVSAGNLQTWFYAKDSYDSDNTYEIVVEAPVGVVVSRDQPLSVELLRRPDVAVHILDKDRSEIHDRADIVMRAAAYLGTKSRASDYPISSNDYDDESLSFSEDVKFYIPREKYIQNEQYYERYILDGLGSYYDVNSGEAKSGMPTDWFRDVFTAIKFNGFNLTPELMHTLGYEMLWESLTYAYTPDEVSRSLWIMVLKEGRDQLISLDESLWDHVIDEGLQRAFKLSGSAAENFSRKYSQVTFAWNLVKDIDGINEDYRTEAAKGYDLVPYLDDFLTAIDVSPGSKSINHEPDDHSSPLARAYRGFVEGFSRDIQASQGSFDEFFDSYYASSASNDKWQAAFKNSLSYTVSGIATALGAGPLSGYVGSVAGEGGAGLSRVYEEATDAYYDPYRAALALNWALYLRDKRLRQGEVERKSDNGETYLDLEQCDTYIMEAALYRRLLRTWAAALHRHFSKYYGTKSDFGAFLTQGYRAASARADNLDKETRYWAEKEQFYRKGIFVNDFQVGFADPKAVGFAGLAHHRANGFPDSSIGGYVAGGAEVTDPEVPQEGVYSNAPKLFITPTKYVDFGEVAEGSRSMRELGLVLGNDSRSFNWSISLPQNSRLKLSTSNGSALGRTIAPIRVILDADTVGEFHETINVQVSVAEVEGYPSATVSTQIEVVGTVIGLDDLLRSEQVTQIDGGRVESFTRLPAMTNDPTHRVGNRTGSLYHDKAYYRFDLPPDLPWGYSVKSAQLELPVAATTSDFNQIEIELSLADYDSDTGDQVTYSNSSIPSILSIQRIPGSVEQDERFVLSFDSASLVDAVDFWMRKPSQNYGLMVGIRNTSRSTANRLQWLALYAAAGAQNGKGPVLRVQLERRDTTKPKLMILNPRSNQVVAGNRVSVRGSASDEHGISRVTANGVTLQLNSVSDDLVTFEGEVPFDPLADSLVVTATDNSVRQNERTKSIPLRRPTFSFFASFLSGAISPGEADHLVIETTSLEGYGEPIEVEIKAAGLIVQPTQSSVTPGQRIEVEIRTPENLPLGDYNVEVVLKSGGVTRSSSVHLQVVDKTPPSIRLLRPGNLEVVQESETVQLLGSAIDKGGSGLRGLILQHFTVNRRESIKLGSSSTFERIVELEPGVNQLSIIAEDNDGNVASKSLRVTREAPPVESTLNPILMPEGNSFPLTGGSLKWNRVIGAERYLVTLRQILPDAESFVSEIALNGTEDRYPLRDLLPGTVYGISVSAVNDWGEIISNEILFQTIGEEVRSLLTFEPASGSSGNVGPLEVVDSITGASGILPYFNDGVGREGLLGKAISLDQLDSDFNWSGETQHELENQMFCAWVRIQRQPDASAETPVRLLNWGPVQLDYIVDAGVLMRCSAETGDLVPLVGDGEWAFVVLKLDRASSVARLQMFRQEQWSDEVEVQLSESELDSSFSLQLAAVPRGTAIEVDVDELAMIQAGQFNIAEWVEGYRERVEFDYTLKFTDLDGNDIPMEYLVKDSTGTAPSGLIPGWKTIVPTTGDHVIPITSLRLPWKPATLELRTFDDRPFSPVIALPLRAVVGEDVKVHVHALDYEPNNVLPVIRASSLSVSGNGELVIVDESANLIWSLDLEDPANAPVLLGGTGDRAFSPDGTIAVEGALKQPAAAVRGFDGNLYIAEAGANRIRMIDSEGKLRTVVGTGQPSSESAPLGASSDQTNITAPSIIRYDDNYIWFNDDGRKALLRIGSGGAIEKYGSSSRYWLTSNKYVNGGRYVGLVGFNGEIVVANDRELLLRLFGEENFTLLAGSYDRGYLANGLPLAQSSFGEVSDIAVWDKSGTQLLLLADLVGRQVLQSDGGAWNVLAGTGATGFPFVGEQATYAMLRRPSAMVPWSDGLIVADEEAGALFFVDQNGLISDLYISPISSRSNTLEYQVDMGGGRLTDWSAERERIANWAMAGSYDVRVRARDASGLVSAWSVANRIEVAVTDPAVDVLNGTQFWNEMNDPLTGEVVLRDSNIIFEGSNLIVAEGASLILDNSNLVGGAGSRLQIESGGSLQLFNGARLSFETVSFSRSSEEIWWSDANDGIFQLRGSRIDARQLSVDTGTVSIENSIISLHEFDNPAKSKIDGEDVAIDLRADHAVRIIGLTTVELNGGAGIDFEAVNGRTGRGGNASLRLEAKGDIVLQGVEADDVQIVLEAGEAGEFQTSGVVGNAGDSGGVDITMLSGGTIELNRVELQLEAGEGRAGPIANERESSGNGGAGGDVVVLLDSSQSIVGNDIWLDAEAGDGGDGGLSLGRPGGVSGVGGNVTIDIRAESGNVNLLESKIKADAGHAGKGGYGRGPTEGGIAGIASVVIVANRELTFEKVEMDLTSGDGGQGGDVRATSSTDVVTGANGSAGGGGGFEAFAETVDLRRSSVSIEAGSGGDGGQSLHQDGRSGGIGGDAAFSISATGLMVLTSFTSDILAGEAGVSSENGGEDDGGAGVQGGSARASVVSTEGSLHLVGFTADVRGGNGSNGEISRNETRHGGKGGSGELNISAAQDLVLSDQDLLVKGGDGKRGGRASRSNGGNGGMGGEALVNFSADRIEWRENAVSKMHFRISAGDGGDAGRSDDDRGWDPGIAGASSMQITANQGVTIVGASGLVLGGEGGEGGRGDGGRHTAGSIGGSSVMQITGDKLDISDAHLVALGGRGGEGGVSKGGEGGLGELKLTSIGLPGEIVGSKLEGLGGDPGESGTSSNIWPAGIGYIRLKGVSNVLDSELGQRLSFESSTELHGVSLQPVTRMWASFQYMFYDADHSPADYFNIKNTRNLTQPAKWLMAKRSDDLQWYARKQNTSEPEFGLFLENNNKLGSIELQQIQQFPFEAPAGSWLQFEIIDPAIEVMEGVEVSINEWQSIEVTYADGLGYEGGLEYQWIPNDTGVSVEGYTHSSLGIPYPVGTMASDGLALTDPVGGVLWVRVPGAVSRGDSVALGSPTILPIVLYEDTDGDSVANVDELEYRTDPEMVDTDGDGLTDFEEIFLFPATNPRVRDSDGDTVDDGVEGQEGSDPLNPLSFGDRPPQIAVIAVEILREGVVEQSFEAPFSDTEMVIYVDSNINLTTTVSDPDGDEVTLKYWVWVNSIQLEELSDLEELVGRLKKHDDVEIVAVAYSAAERVATSVPLRFRVNNTAVSLDVPHAVQVGMNGKIRIPFEAVDRDGDSIAVTVSSLGSGGAYIETDAIIYQPSLNYYGREILVVSAVDDEGAGVQTTLLADVAPQFSSAIDSWIATFFPAEVYNQLEFGGRDGDPDSDGLSNLLEYAMGLDPMAGNFGNLSEISATETDWVYTFKKPESVTDVIYEVETSNDLSLWSTEGVALAEVSTLNGVETWQATLPIASADNVFFRLKVTLEEKFNSPVRLGDLSATYDGTAKPVTAMTTPAGLNVVLTYNGSTTTPVNAGSYMVLGTVDDPNYQGSATGTLVIDEANPMLTWAISSAVTYGTALGETQLNATVSVPGTLSYTPTAGTALDAGVQTLSVTFTPDDAANYKTITTTRTLEVNKALLYVTADDQSKNVGEANPFFTISYDGFVNGDTLADIVEPTISTTATMASAAGNYPIVLSGGSAANYTLVLQNGTLEVITVNSAPSFTTQPADQSVMEGANVNFAVAVVGEPMPTLQWQLSTDDGATWADLGDDEVYSGASSATLTVTGAAIEMDGYQYRATATNSVGISLSPSATLTLKAEIWRGLAQYFKFDGTGTDEVGANSLTLQGVTFDETSPFGYAAVFDGSGDYAAGNTIDPDLHDSGYSVSGWIYLAAEDFTAPDDHIFFFIPEDGSWGQVRITWHPGSPNDPITYRFGSGSDSTNYGQAGQNPSSGWRHVVITHSAAYNRLYVDGVLVHSTAALTLKNNSDALLFGAAATKDLGSMGNFLRGKISNFGIWTRELTEQEVQTLYNDGEGLPLN